MALVSEYGFNEGSGTTTVDSSDNGRNLTVNSSAWTSTGKNNAAVAGISNQYILTGGNAGPSAMTERTVMFWVNRTTATNTSETIFYSLQPGSNFEVVYIDNTNGTVARYDSITGTDYITPSPSIALNAWTHIALVTGASGLKLYINGTLAGSHATTTSRGANNIRLGNGNTDGGSSASLPFLGKIDELRIFDTSLSQADINIWMNTPVGPLPLSLMWVI